MTAFSLLYVLQSFGWEPRQVKPRRITATRPGLGSLAFKATRRGWKVRGAIQGLIAEQPVLRRCLAAFEVHPLSARGGRNA